ncbi:hypothetical protein AGMMS50230_04550 [Spirochaetia bacterium]|nr:hypothetical protein AGMMS50230_04550 [Spirochaetia bacterium]
MKKKVQFLRGAVFTAILFAAVLSCGDGAGWTPEYDIGDPGPGGGKIFYVDAAGFAVSGKGTCHYLEAAPADISGTPAWASPQFLPPAYGGTDDWHSIDGLGTAIGTGAANTAKIRAADPDAPAAKACDTSSAGGKNDWFLPSKDELALMFQNKTAIDGIGTGIYWSSTQYGWTNTWTLQFSDGYQDGHGKQHTYSVRAIRAF